MSKILGLAKDFEAKSKQQANDIENNLQLEFKRQEQSVRKALNSSLEKIKSDISAQNAIMSRLVLRSWIWITVSLLIVFGAIQGVLFWQGSQIVSNQQEIRHQKATIERLAQKGGNIHLSRCEGQICAKVVLKKGTYGKNYMILQVD